MDAESNGRTQWKIARTKTTGAGDRQKAIGYGKPRRQRKKAIDEYSGGQRGTNAMEMATDEEDRRKQ